MTQLLVEISVAEVMALQVAKSGAPTMVAELLVRILTVAVVLAGVIAV